MGGDDLSDDDEYLDYSPSGDGHSSDDGNGGGDSKKKRKGDGNSSLAASDDDDDDDNDDDVKVHNEKKTDRKKRNKTELLTSSSSSSSLQDVLLHAGRGIAMDGLEAQSTFLNKLYSHSIKLVNGAASNSKKVVIEEEEEEEEEPASTTDITTTTATTTYSFLPHLYTLPKELDMSTKVYRHANLNSFLKPSSSGNGGGPLSSNKKLKNWKYPHSPMIIVITLSAIRAVELMKQLSSTIKLPMLKLFAKHMSLEDQVRLLSQGFGKKKNIDNKQTTKNLSSSSSSKKGSKGSGGYYSLAVGTPGRLLKLLRENNNDNTTTNTDELSRGGDMGNSARRGGGALQLHHTELIIIDCHTDSKGWNVCTLNDTSTELMQFMNEGVINQLEKRKGKIKLALF
jgi:hypothetical protein